MTEKEPHAKVKFKEDAEDMQKFKKCFGLWDLMVQGPRLVKERQTQGKHGNKKKVSKSVKEVHTQEKAKTSKAVTMMRYKEKIRNR